MNFFISLAVGAASAVAVTLGAPVAAVVGVAVIASWSLADQRGKKYQSNTNFVSDSPLLIGLE